MAPGLPSRSGTFGADDASLVPIRRQGRELDGVDERLARLDDQRRNRARPRGVGTVEGGHCLRHRQEDVWRYLRHLLGDLSRDDLIIDGIEEPRHTEFLDDRAILLGRRGA